MPRTDTEPLICDLLVVGAGLAGLTAAARAASLGLSTIVAGSSSAFAFYSGLLDVLGCWPPGGAESFDAPEDGLAALLDAIPDHVYAKAGRAAEDGLDRIWESFEFVSGLLNGQGLAYVLPDRRNIPVITAMGTIKRSFLVPRSMTLDGGSVPERLVRKEISPVIAGVKGLAGFSAAQVTGALGQGVPVQVNFPGISGPVPPQVLAARMEGEKTLSAWVDQVRPRMKGADACGVPAVLGLGDHQAVWDSVSGALGCPVFEIPCAPPSIPGMRLKLAFDAYLRQAGATVLSNTRISEPVFDGDRFVLTAGVEPWGRKIMARGVILATGRFFGGGLHARRERIVEPLFHLDVAQPVRRGLWHQTRFLAPEGHGINQAGIETDGRFRPIDERGRPVYRRLYAVGGILARNDWARLKSGAGVAMASAVSAVDAFFREAGHGA